MPEPENGSPLYTVEASAAIAEALRRVQRQAKQEGRGPEVLAAIRYSFEQLRHNPNEVGEPVYRLPVLRLQIRTWVVRPLAVDFGVSEEHPIVFIKGVTLLSKGKG